MLFASAQALIETFIRGTPLLRIGGSKGIQRLASHLIPYAGLTIDAVISGIFHLYSVGGSFGLWATDYGHGRSWTAGIIVLVSCSEVLCCVVLLKPIRPLLKRVLRGTAAVSVSAVPTISGHLVTQGLDM